MELAKGMPLYLNEEQVSEIIGRAVQTLRNDRFNSRGLPYIKLGNQVKYSLSDIVAFMESRKIMTEN
jgi:hypothetical protein